MKVHQDVYVQTMALKDQEILDALKRFGQRTSNWSFMEKQSQEYSEGISELSCMLSLNDRKFDPAFALTREKRGVFYLANIIPRKAERISMSEYNALAQRFASEFRRFSRRKCPQIIVHVSSENIGLECIILGRHERQLFESFLKLHPTSYHPADIKRLDTFICALARSPRRPFDVNRLEMYLLETLAWTAKDARWCRDRVETGLDILRVNRSIYLTRA